VRLAVDCRRADPLRVRKGVQPLDDHPTHGAGWGAVPKPERERATTLDRSGDHQIPQGRHVREAANSLAFEIEFDQRGRQTRSLIPLKDRRRVL